MAHRAASMSRDDKLNTEKLKVAFQFFIMIFCSAFIGYVFCGLLSEELILSLTVSISTHFENTFAFCEGPLEYFGEALVYTLPEIICITFIFFASFATFNYLATDAALLFYGFRFGMSATLLFLLISSDGSIYQIRYSELIIFIIFKIFLLVLLVKYSYTAAKYSYSLKKVGPLGRPDVKIKVLFPFLISSLTYMGSMMILNGIYCLLIYIF